MKKISILNFDELPVSDAEKQEIGKEMNTCHYSKNEVVFRQGEVCPELFLVERGLVKLSYLTPQGKEYIKSFIQEGEIFGSLSSQLTGGPSTFSAHALEELEVKVLSASVFQEIVENNSELQKIMLVFFQQLALKKELREYDFLCLSAQQRYEKFCKQSPDLITRIKQADLALYLGITPIALSRMKRKI